MKTGWLQDNGEWYYFNSKGKMQTGLINIDGNDYQFDESSGQLQIDEEADKTAIPVGTSESDSELGVLSAKYESNGDPAIIANNQGDRGGKSYGAWQLASKVGSVDAFLNWLQGVNYDDHQKLITAKQNDGNTFGNSFDNVWKQLAEEDMAGFLDIQHRYIKQKYYDAAAQKLKDGYGFDISTKSIALQNVLWSTAVQHGDGGAASIFAKIDLAGGDEQIINEVYNERQKVDIYFKGNSSDIKKSVYNRFTSEREDALNMLKSQ